MRDLWRKSSEVVGEAEDLNFKACVIQKQLLPPKNWSGDPRFPPTKSPCGKNKQFDWSAALYLSYVCPTKSYIYHVTTFLHPVLLVHSSFIYLLCFGLFMDLLIGQLREMTEWVRGDDQQPEPWASAARTQSLSMGHTFHQMSYWGAPFMHFWFR